MGSAATPPPTAADRAAPADPATPAAPATPASAPTPVPVTTARVLAWPVATLLAALTAGASTAWLVAGRVPVPGGPVPEGAVERAGDLLLALLRSAALGLLAGTAVLLAVWIAGTVLGAVRCFPRGRRAVPVVLGVALGAGTLLVGLAVLAVSSAAVDPLGGLAAAGLLALLAPVAVPPWWADRLARTQPPARG